MTARAPASAFWIGVTAVVIGLRFWLPTEATASGLTLWIALLTTILSTAWFLVGPECHLRVTLVDGGVLLVVLGHVLGGGLVFWSGGDRHAALNLMLEWLALLPWWWMLRGLLTDPAARVAIWSTVLASTVTLAGFGIWQHLVELPTMARDYGAQIDRYRSAPSVEARLALDRAGIPTEEPDLTLFEKRIRDSREPFAFFALANTLAGVLAWTLPAWLCLTWLPATRSSRPTVLAGLLIVAMCLLLTKSRTAWIGAAAGLGLLLIGQSQSLRRIVPWLLLGSLLIIAASGGLLLTGSLDWQVLAEAPKSLLYRWQYWQGTAALIRESPWLGIGLGQFREEYLRVKLPAASEEIADPHNAWLEAWCQGGLLAVLGILLLTVVVGRRLLTPHALQTVDIPARANAELPLSVVVMGAASPLVVWAVALWQGDGWDDRLWILCAVQLPLLYAVWRVISAVPVSAGLSQAAGVGLVIWFVHLLGAGGLGLPAVQQLIGLGMILSLDDGEEPTDRIVPHGLWCRIPAVASLMLVVTIFFVWKRQTLAEERLDAGMQQLRQFEFGRALSDFQAAATLDPLDPKPIQWALQTVVREPENVTVEVIEQLASEGRRRSPNSIQWDEFIGAWRESRYRATQNPDDAAAAITSFQAAVMRYPTNSRLLASLAQFGVAVDDPRASMWAAKAVNQDDINHQWGHVERYLTAESRRALESLRNREVDDPAKSQ